MSLIGEVGPMCEDIESLTHAVMGQKRLFLLFPHLISGRSFVASESNLTSGSSGQNALEVIHWTKRREYGH